MVQKTKTQVTQLTKKNNKTKKIQKNGGGGLSINDVFDFFNVDDSNRAYLKNTIKDILGLYTLVNLRHKTHYTFINNSIILQNIPVIYGFALDSNAKFSETFRINSIQTSKTTDKEYKYLGTFYKKSSCGYFDFKCVILKNIEDGDIIILFKWGAQVDLTNNKEITQTVNNDNKCHKQTYPKILDKMYEFIMMKLSEIEKKDINILLFGHSMGGNVAQHIALRFLNDKTNPNYKDKLFLVSTGIGSTLPTNELKTKLESELSGRIISIALALYTLPNLLNTNQNKLTQNSPFKLNSLMLQTKPGYKSLHTIVINFSEVHANTDVKFKLLQKYNFNNIPQDINKSVKHIHEFKPYYRDILNMLIDNAN